MPDLIYSFHNCNLGHVLIVTSKVGIKTIELADSRDILIAFASEFDDSGYRPATAQHTEHYRRCNLALELVNGQSTSGSPPLAPDGTDFQQAVWQQLQLIG